MSDDNGESRTAERLFPTGDYRDSIDDNSFRDLLETLLVHGLSDDIKRSADLLLDLPNHDIGTITVALRHCLTYVLYHRTNQHDFVTLIQGFGMTKTGVKSLGIALDIIEALHKGNTSVTDLATTCDCSKSTVHSHLTTLRDRGYVVQDNNGYYLGLRFLDLRNEARSRFNLYHQVRTGERFKTDLPTMLQQVCRIISIKTTYS